MKKNQEGVPDGYPLFDFDKIKIRAYYTNCKLTENRIKYLKDLRFIFETSFVFDVSNPNRKALEKQYPSVSPMLDYNDYRYAYLDFKEYLEELEQYVEHNFNSIKSVVKVPTKIQSQEKPEQKKEGKKLTKHQKYKKLFRDYAAKLWKNDPKRTIVSLVDDSGLQSIQAKLGIKKYKLS